MNFRIVFIIAFFLIGLGVIAQVKPQTIGPSKTKTAKPHRVVYDVTNADTAVQASLVRQLNNLKKGWPDAQVEIVVHGKGLDLVLRQKSYKATTIKDLQQKGVVFAACENTMRFRKVTTADLLPGIITVPMGVGEIIMKQEQGWSYMKF